MQTKNESMSTTVFVDNLPRYLTNEAFQTFFQPYGSLRVIMATSKAGGCLGFGFVVFASAAQAARIGHTSTIGKKDGTMIRTKSHPSLRQDFPQSQDGRGLTGSNLLLLPIEAPRRGLRGLFLRNLVMPVNQTLHNPALNQSQ